MGEHENRKKKRKRKCRDMCNVVSLKMLIWYNEFRLSIEKLRLYILKQSHTCKRIILGCALFVVLCLFAVIWREVVHLTYHAQIVAGDAVSKSPGFIASYMEQEAPSYNSRNNTVDLSDKAPGRLPLCARPTRNEIKYSFLENQKLEGLLHHDLCTVRDWWYEETEHHVYWGARKELHPCDKWRLLTLHKTIAIELTRVGLKWWPTYGSLLGVLRHGGVVPHDTNGEIFVMLESEEDNMKLIRAMKKVREELGEEMVTSACDAGVTSSGGLCTCSCDVVDNDDVLNNINITKTNTNTTVGSTEEKINIGETCPGGGCVNVCASWDCREQYKYDVYRAEHKMLPNNLFYTVKMDVTKEQKDLLALRIADRQQGAKRVKRNNNKNNNNKASQGNSVSWFGMEHVKFDIMACMYRNQTDIQEGEGDVVCNGQVDNVRVYSEDIFPLIQCNFHGHTWPCPNQPGQFLVTLPRFEFDPDLMLQPEGYGYRQLAEESVTCLDDHDLPSVTNCTTSSDCLLLPPNVKKTFSICEFFFGLSMSGPPSCGIRKDDIGYFQLLSDTLFLRTLEYKKWMDFFVALLWLLLAVYIWYTFCFFQTRDKNEKEKRHRRHKKKKQKQIKKQNNNDIHHSTDTDSENDDRGLLDARRKGEISLRTDESHGDQDEI